MQNPHQRFLQQQQRQQELLRRQQMGAYAAQKKKEEAERRKLQQMQNAVNYARQQKKNQAMNLVDYAQDGLDAPVPIEFEKSPSWLARLFGAIVKLVGFVLFLAVCAVLALLLMQM